MIPDHKNPHPSPASAVLKVLSKRPRLSIKELYQFCNLKMTIQGFYKIINQMIEQRILVKEGGLISIEAGWIQNLANFTETLKHTYFEQEVSLSNIILEEGQANTFVFDNPKEMDNFYSHALSIIAEYYRDKKITDKNAYAYNDHNWFQLGRASQEESLLETYQKAGMKLYHVVGQDSFLDKLTLKMFEDYSDFYYLTQKKIPQFFDNYYAMSIGDFIIETSLPKYIHELMDQVFKEVKSLGDFQADKIEYLIKQPGKTKFTITRNRKKAAAFRKKIKNCFYE